MTSIILNDCQLTSRIIDVLLLLQLFRDQRVLGLLVYMYMVVGFMINPECI